MSTTPREQRSAFLEAFRPLVVHAAEIVLASHDPDRVVVLADGTDTSGGNMADYMAAGQCADEWRPAGDVAWCGIIQRPVLASYLRVVWASAGGTIATLAEPPGTGHVWVWIVAAGGCQLVRMQPGIEWAGDGEDTGNNPWCRTALDAGSTCGRTGDTPAQAGTACRAGEAFQ
jgi:hypothetical protein